MSRALKGTAPKMTEPEDPDDLESGEGEKWGHPKACITRLIMEAYSVHHNFSETAT